MGGDSFKSEFESARRKEIMAVNQFSSSLKMLCNMLKSGFVYQIYKIFIIIIIKGLTLPLGAIMFI